MKELTANELLLVLRFGTIDEVTWHLIEIDEQGAVSKFTPEEYRTAELLEDKVLKEIMNEKTRINRNSGFTSEWQDYLGQ